MTTNFEIYSNIILAFHHYLRGPQHSNKHNLKNLRDEFFKKLYYKVKTSKTHQIVDGF